MKSKRIMEIERKMVPILKKHGVAKAGLFGSIVRGDSKRGSDIDILIEFRGRKSLLDLAGLEIELEKKLKKKVDVLTYNSIHSMLRERIMKEEVKVL